MQLRRCAAIWRKTHVECSSSSNIWCLRPSSINISNVQIVVVHCRLIFWWIPIAMRSDVFSSDILTARLCSIHNKMRNNIYVHYQSTFVLLFCFFRTCRSSITFLIEIVNERRSARFTRLFCLFAILARKRLRNKWWMFLNIELNWNSYSHLDSNWLACLEFCELNIKAIIKL